VREKFIKKLSRDLIGTKANQEHKAKNKYTRKDRQHEKRKWKKGLQAIDEADAGDDGEDS